MPESMRGVLWGFLAVAVWGAAVGVGISEMSRWSFTPGRNESVPATWPESSVLPRHECRATLILFGHPRCPCMKASLEQYNRVLDEASAPLDCYIVFLIPSSADAEWRSNEIVRLAKAIPRATVIFDEGEHETRRFAAQTSGQVMLYDPLGQLVFNGGITISRGHRGDNPGARALIRQIHGEPTKVQNFPIFGCPLFQDICSSPENVPCR